MRVWLTDGSGAPFSDLYVLGVQHPGVLGQPVTFKGCIDPDVPVGRAHLDGRPDDVLVPEVEWCIRLAEPGLESQAIDASTQVLIQGLIEGKWLNRVGHSLAWKPASVGNNLVAEGSPIRVALADLEAGALESEAVVTYHLAGQPDEIKTHRTTLADLRGHNILELVRVALQHCQTTGEQVEAVDCSAIGRDAALANDPQFLQAALSQAGLQPGDLAQAQNWPRLVDATVEVCLQSGLAVAPGSSVTLTVLDQNRGVCGRGELTWRPRD